MQTNEMIKLTSFAQADSKLQSQVNLVSWWSKRASSASWQSGAIELALLKDVGLSISGEMAKIKTKQKSKQTLSVVHTHKRRTRTRIDPLVVLFSRFFGGAHAAKLADQNRIEQLNSKRSTSWEFKKRAAKIVKIYKCWWHSILQRAERKRNEFFSTLCGACVKGGK